MKRRLLIIGVFLLLGAIVNVAAAWCCTITHRQHITSVLQKRANPYRGMGQTPTPADAGGRISIDVRLPTISGWPMDALSCMAYEFTDSGRLFPTTGVWNRGIQLDSQSSTRLPVKPIWPGFAINTLFYAATMWLLFAGPFAFRRWRRQRLGRCVKCGYDLRGRGTAHDRCPECGVELGS